MTDLFSWPLNMADMDLLTFITDPGRKAALAARTESSEAYLWQIATAWTPKGGKPKRASTALAQAIERESALIGPEAVPKESLRPDVWPPEEGAAVSADAHPAAGIAARQVA